MYRPDSISITISDNPGWAILVYLIIPLISFLFLFILKEKGKIDRGLVSSIIHGAGLMLGIYLFRETWNDQAYILRMPWFTPGSVGMHNAIDFVWKLDHVSILMSLIVYIISLLVQVFSIYYMKGDDLYRRYYAYLGLFTFSMLGIVLSGNLLITFVFWELVGFSSYLLIGFWFYKPSAAYAGRKAFIVNRIGDLGFLLALGIIWAFFGTFEIELIKERLSEAGMQHLSSISGLTITWLTIAGFGIFSGAIGKSAQFPLLVWLPDAMEGPTPVSALIHAATMVAAGVYLLFKVFALLTIPVLDTIAFLGITTAFMAAVAALTQYDIKKVLAYSTISQLGYMVAGIGVGAREAALMHLFTHAFFKAGLFLSAGIIIKSIHDLNHSDEEEEVYPQDMRMMGGLKSKMPFVFIVFLIFSGALMGLPFFSGFISKDAIITSSIAWSMERGIAYMIIPVMLLLSVGLTVLYIVRVIVLTFLGKARSSTINSTNLKLKEGTVSSRATLVLLAICSLGIVFAINPFSMESSWIYSGILSDASTPLKLDSLILNFRILELVQKYHTIGFIASIIMITIGLVFAFFKYKPLTSINNSSQFNKYNSTLPGRISYNSWYLDDIYVKLFVNPFNKLSNLSYQFDVKIIDRTIDVIGIINVVLAHLSAWIDAFFIDGLVNLIARAAGFVGKKLRTIQQGSLQGYYLWALFILMIVIIVWIT